MAKICAICVFLSALFFGAQRADSLPFTLGSSIPLQIKRYTVDGKEYYLYTFERDGDVRPSILYGDASFMADKIVYDDLAKQVTALGNVRVTLGPQVMHGEHLEYNLESGRGMLTEANLRGHDVRVTGGKIEIREMEVKDRYGVRKAYSFEVRDGSVTACEYTIPHYHLTSNFLRIIPDVRVWLYSAAYRVTGIPIFYLPYLTRSLRKEPFAYVFEPGLNNRKGFVLLNRFHFHYQDVLYPWARGTAYVDYFSKQGVGVGGKWTYLRQPEADSYLYGYYINQQDDFDENALSKVRSTEGSRGKFAFQHFQRFGKGWTLTGKGRRLSDPNFDEDYRTEEIKRGFEQEDLSSDRDAFLNLAKRKTNSNFRVIYKERLEDFNLLDFPEDERQEVVYDSKRRPFSGTDIYHRYRFSAGHYKSHQTTGTGNVDRIDNRFGGLDADIEQEFYRANLKTELNRPFTFRDFSLIPFVGLEFTGYGDPTRKTRVWTHQGENVPNIPNASPQILVENYDGLVREILSGGVEFITRRAMYFDDPSRGVERRLLVEPSVTLAGILPSEDFDDLRPDTNKPRAGTLIRTATEVVNRRDYPGFPAIDEVDSIRDEFFGLELRLEGRFQTRKTGGASRDVVRAALSTSVDFTKNDPGEEKFSTVFAELFVSPFEWLHYSGFLEYEPRGSFVKSVRNSLQWDPDYPFSIEVAHSSYKFDEKATAQEELAVIFDLNLSDRYTITYEERYDLDESISRLRRLGIVRDFHDWLLEVGVHQSNRSTRNRSFGTFFTLTLKTPKGLQGAIPVGTSVTGTDEEGVVPPI